MPRPKTATTQALEKIAARAGISPKYCRELHAAGMPLTLKAALAWLEARPTGDDSQADDSTQALRRARIALVRAQTLKAEFAHAVEQGLYVSREYHENCGRRIGATVQVLLRKLEQELPKTCYGVSSMGKLREAVKDRTREIQDAVALELLASLKRHPEG